MDKKIKILYLVTQSEFGGAQRYISDLVTHLPDTYLPIVAYGGEGNFIGQLKQQGIECIKIQSIVRDINPISDIQSIKDIFILCKKIRPDVVHLNSSKVSITGSIAAKLAGVPKIIYTVHGFVFNEPLPFIKKVFYILAEKISAYFKDYLICVSKKDCETGYKYRIINKKKAVTIHHGLYPIDFIKPTDALQKLNLPVGKQIIGTIANLYPTKGIPFFVNAAKKVTTIHPNAIFVVIGSGILEQHIRQLIKKNGLEGKFILAGQIENAYRYLTAFNYFVLPSLKEGFPYALLEAMTAGLPIIATSVGGVPEIIENEKNGLIVPPANSGALADAILKLFEDENLATELAMNANIDVGEKFDFLTMLVKTERLYRS